MAIFPGSAIQSAGGVYTYPIDQSLRFEDGSSAYLNRTPASAGNRKTWTFSTWFKRGNTVNGTLFGTGLNSTNYTQLYFINSGQTLAFIDTVSSVQANLNTSAVFRDPSAWYHIVLSFDTTQATASDRLKLYINGALETNFSYSVYPSLNFESNVNMARVHSVGALNYTAGIIEYWDGYMAEVNFIDGQALGPEYFGETDDTWGIWKPKAYSGSYGTNGFYLDFSNGADLGEDQSGNNNDFTSNNLAATDVMLDTPTNNFCVMNPALYVAGNNCTYSEGNLRVTRFATNWETVHSTMAVTSGKWYWEVYLNDTNHMIGVCDPNSDVGELISVYSRAGLWNLQGNGDIYANGAGADTSFRGVITFTGTDKLMVALDADSGKVWIGKNGTWFNSGNPAAGTGNLFSSVSTDSGFIAPSSTFYSASSYQHFNFGQDSSFAGLVTAQNNTDDNGYGDFYYAPPSGFLALCSANLDDPTVVPSEHFNTVLYTGDGSTTKSITGVGFQPDFTWVKSRSDANGHVLVDSVRGALKKLKSHTTSAEITTEEYGNIQSLDTDGFTVVKGAGDDTNHSGFSYAAWNWKADNTSGSSNTDGSITSTVAANPDAGFSIVSYTGNATAGATVGHGLSQAPEMLIIKGRDTTFGWLVYHSGIAADAETDYIYLNYTDSATDSAAAWNDTAPTSSVFSVGISATVNNVNPYIAYCFHSVPGYSKFGSYIGNGSADGPFVYTGFRPAFILVKHTSSSSWNWVLWDNEREQYNGSTGTIFPNTSGAEYTGDVYRDITSNGFKLRSSSSAVNQSGSTYIYMAFSSYPFKYSTAR